MHWYIHQVAEKALFSLILVCWCNLYVLCILFTFIRCNKSKCVYFHSSATMGHLLLTLLKKKEKKSQLSIAVFVQVTVCGWILCWGEEGKGEGRGRKQGCSISHLLVSSTRPQLGCELWPSTVAHITMMMQTNAQIWRKQPAPPISTGHKQPAQFLGQVTVSRLEVGPEVAATELFKMKNKR